MHCCCTSTKRTFVHKLLVRIKRCYCKCFNRIELPKLELCRLSIMNMWYDPNFNTSLIWFTSFKNDFNRARDDCFNVYSICCFIPTFSPEYALYSSLLSVTNMCFTQFPTTLVSGIVITSFFLRSWMSFNSWRHFFMKPGGPSTMTYAEHVSGFSYVTTL